MGIPILSEIERLINERGSSNVLLQRLALASDQYSALEKKLSESNLRNEELQSENTSLHLDLEKAQDEIRNHKKQLDKPIHEPRLTFDQQTGTWVDGSTSLHYCPKCKTQNTMSPMRDYGHGWNCAACGNSYRDPSRPDTDAVISVPRSRRFL